MSIEAIPDPGAPQRRLSWTDTRTLLLAALGGALEFYDFIIFVFFTGVIAQLFFPPDMPEWLRQLQTFGIFAAGYLMRPLGGIVMAHFGDRLGRKRMFMLSVLLMALPTLLMGFLPTYAAIGAMAPGLLLLLRALQGAAVGGEVPGAWVFVAEHVPGRHVGLACGVLTAGLTLGILAGSLMSTLINAVWTAQEVVDGVWRLPFLLGGAFGLLAVWLRRYLHETPVFEEMRRRKTLVQGLPLREVLAGHRVAVLRSMLLTWLLTAGIVVVILMTPPLAQAHFSLLPAVTQIANSAATLALLLGCVAYGAAADRFGIRCTIAMGSFLLVLAVTMLYLVLEHAPGYFLPAYVLAGLTVGVVAAVPKAMVEAFPAQLRFSGLSFAYNVAYALAGGLTPLVVGYWALHDRMAPAWYVGLVGAVAFLAVTWPVPAAPGGPLPLGKPGAESVSRRTAPVRSAG